MPFRQPYKNANLTNINDLPNELLLDIFASCAVTPLDYSRWSSGQNVDVEHTFQVGAMPWCLTHVSRRWRALALSSPALWAVLIFPGYGSVEVDHNMVLTQLQRSLDYPLTLHIPSYVSPDVFGTLVEEAHRWKRVFIGFEDSRYHYCVLTALPLLEYLHCGSSTFDHYFPPIDRAYFPRLKSISCHGSFTLFNESPSMAISDNLLSQVTHLALEDSNQQELHFKLGKSAPFLTSLELASLPEPREDLEEVILPALRRIYAVSHIPECIIQTLECPVLEEMSLSCSTRRLEMIDPWISLVARSGCRRTLTSLTILNFRWFEDELFDLLELATNLQHLHLSFFKTASGFRVEYQTEQLLAKLSDEGLCPQLKDFALIQWNSRRVLHTMIAFTRLIRLHGHRFSFARLSVHDSSSALDSPWLVRNQQETLIRLGEEMRVDLRIECWPDSPPTVTKREVMMKSIKPRNRTVGKLKAWLS